jgi:secreted trypsin-like serine protease
VKTAVALFIEKNNRKDYFCSGTILSSTWVATACHCLQDKDARDLLVVAGESDLKPYYTNKSSSWVEVHVIKSSINPKYNFLQNKRYDWDVCLLELNEPLPLNDKSNIEAARLPPPGVIYTGKEISVGGWGKKGLFSRTSQHHLTIDVTIKDDEECINLYRGVAEFCENSMFCAGQTGKTTCHGDSGSGAIYHGWGIPLIVGVVSFGAQTCNDASVFQKIEKSLPWIFEESQLQ